MLAFVSSAAGLCLTRNNNYSADAVCYSIKRTYINSTPKFQGIYKNKSVKRAIVMEVLETRQQLESIARAMQKGVEVKDRTYNLKIYRNCFVGTEACQWIVKHGYASNDRQAVELGKRLVEFGFVSHVVREHDFENENLFYVFQLDSRSHGSSKKSWQQVNAKSTQHPTVWPLDESNTKLLDKVAPLEWQNPHPDDYLYDLVVIGAGAGGLVSAAGAAGVGARVALIEKNLLGGDCLNVGCVPSKALLASAKQAHIIHKYMNQGTNPSGINIQGNLEIDFAQVMKRLRDIRAQIADNDSASRFTDKLGIDVYQGTAQFTSKNSVRVQNKELRFIRCVIATGGTPKGLPNMDPNHVQLDVNPADPKAPSLVCALTHKSIFNLTQRPNKLLVIGTGVVGCELAQAFQRLGSQVTLMGRGSRILKKEDDDAAQLVLESLRHDNVNVVLGVNSFESIHKLESSPSSVAPFQQGVLKYTKTASSSEENYEESFDAVLFALGHTANVKTLGLEMAGVDFDLKKGIKVNDMLATSNAKIFATGDVVDSPFKFTHAADFMARAAIRNALFFGSEKLSDLNIPRCTFTDPELAVTGMTKEELISKNIAFDEYVKNFADNDRSICETQNIEDATSSDRASKYEPQGFVRVLTAKDTDTILGCTIVGDNAGELINVASLAMKSGIGLGSIASVIHPYPVRADALRACGDLYNRTKLTNQTRAALRSIIKLREIL